MNTILIPHLLHTNIYVQREILRNNILKLIRKKKQDPDAFRNKGTRASYFKDLKTQLLALENVNLQIENLENDCFVFGLN